MTRTQLSEQAAGAPTGSTAATDAPTTEPVLVLAPTGKTGRRVAERLRAAGIQVRARSRRSTPTFSWQDPATWDAALDGVHGVYLAYSPDLPVPGAVEHVAAFAARARAAGVERLVMLSGRGEAAAQEAEQRAREHLPQLTCLRAGWFWQNFTEGDFSPMVTSGVLALPVDETPEPFVDCEDIAEVAVAALLDEPGAPGGRSRHAGQTYELTGPVTMTFAQAAHALSAQRGHPVRFVAQTLPEAHAAWETAGVPAETRWLLGELFGTVFDGRNSGVGDGVLRALGRSPRVVGAVVDEPDPELSAASAPGTSRTWGTSAVPVAGGQR